MTRTLSADDRSKLRALAGRVAVSGGVLEMRAGGVKLDDAKLDALLAKAVARERVELEVELLAYEQGALDSKGGRKPNRKGVRVRDGALAALARSFKGAPFMRDHDRGNTLAKGGTILDSRLEKGDNGYSRIVQTVLLVEPSAVERALRGLLSAVSIGMNPTPGAELICTACGSEIFTKCCHTPLEEVDGELGRVIVEWEWSDVEGVETSECPIPAVQNAGATAIRSAAFALLQYAATPSDVNKDHIPMKRTFALLKLADGAGDDQAAEAVTELQRTVQSKDAEIAILSKRDADQSAELAAFRAVKKTTERTTFLDGLVSVGKITAADRELWGALYDADETKAKAMGDKLAANAATPVGAPAQSVTTAPAVPAAGAKPASEFKHGTMLALPGESYEQWQARKAAAQKGSN